MQNTTQVPEAGESTIGSPVSRRHSSERQPQGENQTRPRAMRSRMAKVGKVGLAPLKEAAFVSVGMMDWLIEQFWNLEQTFKDRGERRSTAVTRAVSGLGSRVGAKASPLYHGLRERTKRIGQAIREELPEAETEEEGIDPNLSIPGRQQEGPQAGIEAPAADSAPARQATEENLPQAGTPEQAGDPTRAAQATPNQVAGAGI